MADKDWDLRQVFMKFGYPEPKKEAPLKPIQPPKFDCFAHFTLENRAVCSALKYMYCRCGECRFYKNKEDYENGKRSDY